MGFADDVKKFADQTKARMDGMVEQVRKNAEAQLRDVLGDDVNKIKSIALDADVGKFHQIDAPDFVIEKLRKANLLKE